MLSVKGSVVSTAGRFQKQCVVTINCILRLLVVTVNGEINEYLLLSFW